MRRETLSYIQLQLNNEDYNVHAIGLGTILFNKYSAHKHIM